MDFTLYWLTGDKEVVSGRDIVEAMNKNYSAGALRVLDFYAEGKNEDYEFVDGRWTWTEKRKKELGVI